MKRLAEIANIISAAVALYLLIKPQSGVSLSIPNIAGNLPLVILCLSVVGAAVLNFAALRQKTSTSNEQKSIQDDPPTTGGTLAPSANFPAAFGKPTILPDGREVVSCTPKDLQALYRTHTIVQISRLFSGKWLKLYGKIDNISGPRLFMDSVHPMVVLTFDVAWAEQLSTLTRESSVTIRDKMAKADHATFTLAECELL